MKLAIEALTVKKEEALSKAHLAETSVTHDEALEQFNEYKKAIWWLKIYDEAANWIKKVTGQNA